MHFVLWWHCAVDGMSNPRTNCLVLITNHEQIGSQPCVFSAGSITKSIIMRCVFLSQGSNNWPRVCRRWVQWLLRNRLDHGVHHRGLYLPEDWYCSPVLLLPHRHCGSLGSRYYSVSCTFAWILQCWVILMFRKLPIIQDSDNNNDLYSTSTTII